MIESIKIDKIIALFLLLLWGAIIGASGQETSKEKTLPTGTPVLWESVNVSERDLYLGPGGDAMRPDLSRVTFIEEEKGGYSGIKYKIRDAADRVWVAKVSKESQSETAAVRLVWAMGYKTEINYLVPRLNIPGKGSFTNARLEARPNGVKRLHEWQWEANPFISTKEFQGLKILMALLHNWDVKDSNNQILFIDNGGANELHYIISDLGATFGKTGDIAGLWRINRSRSEPADYKQAKFIGGVEQGLISFPYQNQNRKIFKDITVDQARWIADMLSQLSDKQIADAFRAANYNKGEVEMLTQAVKSRISELNVVTGQIQAGSN